MNNNPLNRHDLSTLNKALSALADARAMRDRLQAAGIDTAEADQQIAYLEHQLSAIKTQFFAEYN